MLCVQGLSHGYKNTPILDNISFSLEKGELCGLFGPNGSGKTTLFRCCLGFITPNRGNIRFKGRDTKKMTCREMARQVAYVPQHHTPPFPFKVKEMVLMGRTPHLNRFFLPGSRDRRMAEEAMDWIGISDLASLPYDILSGGQQQLVLIARAIAQETDLIFLDEPTSALDFKNQIRLWQTLQHIAEQGTAILACTHDPNHVSWFCRSTVVLDRSQLIAKGAPGQVMTQEMMDRIYTDTCQVKDLNGLKIMVPGTVDLQSTNVVAFPGTRKGIHQK